MLCIWWQLFFFMSDLFLTSFISTAKSFSSWNKIGLLKNDPAASSYATATFLMLQSYKTFFSKSLKNYLEKTYLILNFIGKRV